MLSVAVVQLDSGGEREAVWSTLLNPGCDPGPTEIHGITPERLAGAPTFPEVVDDVLELLRGRVFVAHNAAFDWRFLAIEAGRLGRTLPCPQRLCTLALSRRLGLGEIGLPNLRLATVAQHWGVPLGTAHDAVDDAVTAAGVLRHSLAAARETRTPLPLVSCGGERVVVRARPPRYHGQWSNPGRLDSGAPLVQGMRVTITGPTARPREELYQRCHAAGLDARDSVTRKTSVLVHNHTTEFSRKAEKAAKFGVPVIDEASLIALLDAVKPGTAALETPSSTRSSAPARTSVPVRHVTSAVPVARPAGPLAGRRVLVVGWPHIEATRIRRLVAEMGAAVAVNLTVGVTDVVCLPGAEADPRISRARERGVPVIDAGRLSTTPAIESAPALPAIESAPLILPRGGVVDLPTDAYGQAWTIGASWSWQNGGNDVDVDVAAFLLDDQGQVRGDEDFVFFNQPASRGGSVELTVDGDCEQSIRIALDDLPAWCSRVRVIAALSGAVTFGDVGPIQIQAQASSGSVFAQATLDAATTERIMLLANVYRRGDAWRIRAEGQGHDEDLAWLATAYGVEVAD